MAREKDVMGTTSVGREIRPSVVRKREGFGRSGTGSKGPPRITRPRNRQAGRNGAQRFPCRLTGPDAGASAGRLASRGDKPVIATGVSGVGSDAGPICMGADVAGSRDHAVRNRPYVLVPAPIIIASESWYLLPLHITA